MMQYSPISATPSAQMLSLSTVTNAVTIVANASAVARSGESTSVSGVGPTKNDASTRIGVNSSATCNELLSTTGCAGAEPAADLFGALSDDGGEERECGDRGDEAEDGAVVLEVQRSRDAGEQHGQGEGDPPPRESSVMPLDLSRALRFWGDSECARCPVAGCTERANGCKRALHGVA
jgi:hypothetical protein